MNPSTKEAFTRILWGNRGEGRQGCYLEAVWTLAVGGRHTAWHDGGPVLSHTVPVSDAELDAIMNHLPEDVRDRLVDFVEDELVDSVSGVGEKLYSRLLSLGWVEGRWLKPERDRDPLSW